MDKGIQLNSSRNKKINIKPLSLLKGITQAIIGSKTGDISGGCSGISDTIESISLKETTGQVGWKLVSRALVDALCTLIAESPDKYQFLKEEIETEELDRQLDEYITRETHSINTGFFSHPAQLPFIDNAKPILREFLQLFHFADYETDNLLNRLNSYFVFSLVREWRANSQYYKELTEKLNTPFDGAASQESEWLAYSQRLMKQVDEPVFNETFGLKDIYIPLRACYTLKKENKLPEKEVAPEEQARQVVRIDDYLLAWLDNGKKDDAIRLVSGGPGYGKSSLLKMLAARLVERGKRVLFIPLHRFEVKSDLTEGVSSFLKTSRYFTDNPLDTAQELIIIFDGLDELAMQGELLADVAQKFLREVERKITTYNHEQAFLKIIISGRDVIVQQNKSEFRKPEQILQLLPYQLNEYSKYSLKGEESVIEEDQRHLWWKTYGQLKQKDYKGLPPALQNDDLDEITAQPLLNYLVALSYERGIVKFDETTNLNTVYDDLLEAVYRRSYSASGCLKVISNLSQKEFVRLLEEIALSAWHGNGRTTTIGEIEKHMKDSALEGLLNKFVKDAKNGVLSLLAAFYFRQSEQTNNNSQTFEFTHKSFGEYLMAKRIVEKIGLIDKKVREREESYDEGWTAPEALSQWLMLFGPKDLDLDIIKFIRNEMALRDNETLQHIQQTLVKLINHTLRHEMPVERHYSGLTTYKEAYNYAINSEKALLVVHSLVAQQTNTVSAIDWPTEYSCSEWLSKLEALSTNDNTLRFLNHLNLNNSCLYIKGLINCNLSYSSLIESDLSWSNLILANLQNTNLTRANLTRANLTDTNLTDADLTDADLTRANLNGANLNDANLNSANLTDANLTNADLTGAKFRESNLLTCACYDGIKISASRLKQLKRIDKSKVTPT